jgi:DNA-binding winged helix-turn-helix (wHTH) protein
MGTIHALGPFRLDTQDDLLFRGSEPVALGQRAIALLRALIERPGAVISKERLIEAGRPGQAVEESNLTVQIAALRRVLREGSGGDRWIETLPRRGSRFIGQVDTKEENSVTPAVAPVDIGPTRRDGAEHRQITAMSCELVGMTARTDGNGVEGLREAVGAFQRCASETVARHPGLARSKEGRDPAGASTVWRRAGQ